MSNPFFDFTVSTFRFVPRTKAKAEDVNARLDEVSLGFDGVKADLDSLVLSKAPLASPDFSGVPTLANEPLATQAYARSLAFSASLPIAVGDKGKVARVNTGGLGEWGDWWGVPVTLTVASNGVTLAVRTTYYLDSSGGAFAVLMPVMATGDWIKLVDIGGQLQANNVTVTRNGANGNLAGYAEDRILDVSGDSLELVKTAASGVIEQ